MFCDTTVQYNINSSINSEYDGINIIYQVHDMILPGTCYNIVDRIFRTLS